MTSAAAQFVTGELGRDRAELSGHGRDHWHLLTPRLVAVRAAEIVNAEAGAELDAGIQNEARDANAEIVVLDAFVHKGERGCHADHLRGFG